MGDKVSFLDSLVVTIFSMVVVFIVLILISYLINLLKLISNKEKKIKINQIVNAEKIERAESSNHILLSTENLNEELVATISAAIASSIGLNMPNINIKSIGPVPPDMNIWADMGRREQAFRKLQ